MERPSRGALLELAKNDPEAIVDLVERLFDRIEALEEKVAALQKNSSNSSKPPSSDQHNPSRSRKGKARKSQRKPGGQQGHLGYTLHQVENPDHIIEHQLPKACSCGTDLSMVEAEGFETRQVFDLPSHIKIQSTEHRAYYGICPCCRNKVKSAFPEHVNAPVQYGPNIRTVATYLHTYQLLPFERLAECLEDLFDWRPSPGTIANILESVGTNVAPVTNQLKSQISKAPYIHLDETSLSLGGKKHWLYTASTDRQTYLYLHPNRSRNALKDFGVLEDYEGFAIHDFYSIYLPYNQCQHGLCNAHHLRDLKYVEEELGQRWAPKLSKFLIKAKQLKEQAQVKGKCIEPSQLRRLHKEYMQILSKGMLENPEPVKNPRQRGKPKRGKALNLLNRLIERDKEVLAFLYHDVPFDNNQAERDLRMMKTKQKISGCFRSISHANAFINLRSIIASARKQAVNVLDIIRTAILSPEEVGHLLEAH